MATCSSESAAATPPFTLPSAGSRPRPTATTCAPAPTGTRQGRVYLKYTRRSGQGVEVGREVDGAGFGGKEAFVRVVSEGGGAVEVAGVLRHEVERITTGVEATQGGDDGEPDAGECFVVAAPRALLRTVNGVEADDADSHAQVRLVELPLREVEPGDPEVRLMGPFRVR